MSEKWVLVPVDLTEEMGDELRAIEFEGPQGPWSNALHYHPPIPDDVWSEMVERGARAICIEDGADPDKYASANHRCAEACICAALGIDQP